MMDPFFHRFVRSAGWTPWSLTTVVFIALLNPACRPQETASLPPIAVTSSYLAAAVADLSRGRLETVLLAEPGTCPGHFDLTPGQVRRLKAARLLLQFDFQQGLDRYLASSPGIRVCAVEVPPAMARPASYFQVCRQVAHALIDTHLLDPDQAARELVRIEQHLQDLETWARAQIVQAGLENQPVLSAVHQAEFLRWLGLNVVATFTSADALRIEQLHRTLTVAHQDKPRLLLANRAEGLEPARSLAQHLRVPLVVLDNFPSSSDPDAFEALFRSNVEAILAAIQ